MVEVLDQALDKTSETLQEAKDDGKDLIALLLRSSSSDGSQLFDELDERNDQTAERD